MALFGTSAHDRFRAGRGKASTIWSDRAGAQVAAAAERLRSRHPPKLAAAATGALAGLMCTLGAQAASPPPNVQIWPQDASGTADEAREQESVIKGQRFVRNVSRASLDVYLPEAAAADGSAMVVCPGGAFRFLNMSDEGERIARWLNARGIAAFVLHYRLKRTPHSDLLFFAKMLFELPPLLNGRSIDDPSAFKVYEPPAVDDGRQALRWLRGQAAQWHLVADRIGIAGFSAGGVVALGTALAPQSGARPNFVAALYSGPIDTGHVPADAPPLFAAAAEDDPLTALATRPTAQAWQAAGAPVELHLYQHGGHGFKKGTDSDRWMDDFGAWLDARRRRT